MEEFWSAASGVRRLDGNERVCCLCLEPNDDRFVSIDVRANNSEPHYRTIVRECFRIELLDDAAYVLCLPCCSLLKRTWTFFLQIKHAQFRLIAHSHSEKEIKREIVEIERKFKDEDSYDNSRIDEVKIEIEDVKIVDDAPRRERKKIFECPNCDEVFKRARELKNHAIEAHGESRAKKVRKPAPLPYRLEAGQTVCPACGDSFVGPLLLARHMNVHYPNYTCDVCGAPFATKRRVDNHRRYSHPAARFACAHCDKSYKVEYALELHRRSHVEGAPPRRCRCPECPQRFHNTVDRRRHLVAAHGRAPAAYACKSCEAVFDESKKLHYHNVKVHLKLRRFACALCGREFFRRDELRRHEAIHAGVKNFECDRCGKRFARRCKLAEHIRSHDNVRNHACDVCHKAFVQKCTLRAHLRTHEK